MKLLSNMAAPDIESWSKGSSSEVLNSPRWKVIQMDTTPPNILTVVCKKIAAVHKKVHFLAFSCRNTTPFWKSFELQIE